MRGIRGFFRGMSYPVRGLFFLLRKPRTWPYAVLPALINLVALVVLGVLVFFWLDEIYRFLEPDSISSSGAAKNVATVLGRGVVRLVVAVATLAASAAIAFVGAFLAAFALGGFFVLKLSEVVEECALGRPVSHRLSMIGLPVGVLRALSSVLQRLLVYLAVAVPLGVLSLLPGVNLVSGAVLFLYSLFFLAMNFVEPVLERHDFSFRARVRWAFGHLALYIGFGFSVLVLLAPMAVVAGPVFTAGGTLLWLDAHSRR